MARRKRTGNRTFPKRATLWLPFEATVALTTAGAVVQTPDLLGNYFGQTGEEVPIGTTLGPVRGRWSIRPDVATATDFSAHVEALMQLVPEGGRAVAPIPGVDIVDAMWYGQMFALFNEVETASGVFAVISGNDQEFVTKAMRKVTGNGQELKISAVLNTSVDYDVTWLGHIMLKLP